MGLCCQVLVVGIGATPITTMCCLPFWLLKCSGIVKSAPHKSLFSVSACEFLLSPPVDPPLSAAVVQWSSSIEPCWQRIGRKVLILLLYRAKFSQTGHALRLFKKLTSDREVAGESEPHNRVVRRHQLVQ